MVSNDMDKPRIINQRTGKEYGERGFELAGRIGLDPYHDSLVTEELRTKLSAVSVDYDARATTSHLHVVVKARRSTGISHIDVLIDDHNRPFREDVISALGALAQFYATQEALHNQRVA